jgi:hypothetical protein
MARKKPVAWAAVYLVQYGDFVKVGITNDPAARLRTLQTGMPGEVAMPYLVVLPERDMAIRLERRLHKRLADRHERGEWFRIGLEEAISATDEESGVRGKPSVSMQFVEAVSLAETRQLGRRLKVGLAA